MTYADDKSKTNVAKLHDSERVKYDIHNAVKKTLKHYKTWEEFVIGLALQGVKLEFVGRSGKMKTADDIQRGANQQGVLLCKIECHLGQKQSGNRAGF